MSQTGGRDTMTFALFTESISGFPAGVRMERPLVPILTGTKLLQGGPRTNTTSSNFACSRSRQANLGHTGVEPDRGLHGVEIYNEDFVVPGSKIALERVVYRWVTQECKS